MSPPPLPARPPPHCSSTCPCVPSRPLPGQQALRSQFRTVYSWLPPQHPEHCRCLVKGFVKQITGTADTGGRESCEPACLRCSGGPSSPTPRPMTYWNIEPPPPTHRGTCSSSRPPGRTPRGRLRLPGRTRCGARAAPPLRAAGRTWGRPRPGRSPAACRPWTPPSASTPGRTHVPMPLRARPAPPRRMDWAGRPTAGRRVSLQMERASEGWRQQRVGSGDTVPGALPRPGSEASVQSQVPSPAEQSRWVVGQEP